MTNAEDLSQYITLAVERDVKPKYGSISGQVVSKFGTNHRL